MALSKENTITYQNILVERENRIAIITLNRPGVLNALSQTTVDELDAAIDELGADESVRATITGAGEVVRITHTPGDGESWSPASTPGGAILFTSNRDGKQEVYCLAGAGEVVRITHTPGDGESWLLDWYKEETYYRFSTNMALPMKCVASRRSTDRGN